MNRLSVRRMSVTAPWVDRTDAPAVDFLDWVIDGVPLREHVDADAEMTLLGDEEWIQPHRVEAIARLRGELTTPPVFVPTFHQTKWQRRLGRRGVPVARFGAAFDDARVGLLFCLCGDIDCPTLSTEVVVSDDTVEWRNIGWQVSYAPFGTHGIAPPPARKNAIFDRTDYDTLLTSLSPNAR